ncbi:unnamed protein product [Cercopithifilaria johnstoni]|uniref:Uncharacterized protein n=1 Tax=Cercopithifilaria johnstoni TaxID=2874296 RepID=A0A8J2M834_9BILA|nr:unnamed protein product [Cercopithifilaria johnstoni]
MGDEEWNISWNSDEYVRTVEPTTAAENKKMRQARIAARTEARRMEMARKRTARSSGGTQITSNNDGTVH